MISKLKVLITENTDPYHNLALEKYLFDTNEPDSCLLYLWRNEKTVVIGHNQNAFNECNLAVMETDGITLVRRLSGGGAVYHDLGNLNFTFICPKKDFDEAGQSSIILDALAHLGIRAERNGRNDLLADGKKFSGHAYYHHGNTSYHHGTLMVSVDKDKLSRYLNVSVLKLNDKHVRSVRSRIINLNELNPDISIDSLRKNLIRSFSEHYFLPVSFISEKELDKAQISRLTEYFADHDHNYGSSKQLPLTREARFSWGTVRIEYELREDIITDVMIYSDSLQTDYLSELPSLIRGKNINRLEEVLDDPDYQDINRDIISLLKSTNKE